MFLCKTVEVRKVGQRLGTLQALLHKAVPNLPNLPNLPLRTCARVRTHACTSICAGARAHTHPHTRNSTLGRLGRLGRVRTGAGFELPNLCPTFRTSGETMPPEQKKPMRALMPLVTEFVDAFRDAGLTNNATIARGLKGGSCWFAEGDQYIGLPGARERSRAQSDTAVKGDDLCITTKAERDHQQEIRARRRGGRG